MLNKRLGVILPSLVALLIAIYIQQRFEYNKTDKTSMTFDDQNVWLEEVLDEKALEWVKGIARLR
jgi:hypothetical protein